MLPDLYPSGMNPVQDTSRPQEPRGPVAQYPHLEKARIIVVDDHKPLGEGVAFLLQSVGAEDVVFVHMQQFEEGLQEVRSAMRTPEPAGQVVVLSDYSFAECGDEQNGAKLVETLKQDGPLRTSGGRSVTPLFVGTSAEESRRQAFQQSGAVGFIFKEPNIELYAGTLEEVLQAA